MELERLVKVGNGPGGNLDYLRQRLMRDRKLYLMSHRVCSAATLPRDFAELWSFKLGASRVSTKQDKAVRNNWYELIEWPRQTCALSVWGPDQWALGKRHWLSS